jgi:hypothetical protein
LHLIQYCTTYIFIGTIVNVKYNIKKYIFSFLFPVLICLKGKVFPFTMLSLTKPLWPLAKKFLNFRLGNLSPKSLFFTNVNHLLLFAYLFKKEKGWEHAICRVDFSGPIHHLANQPTTKINTEICKRRPRFFLSLQLTQPPPLSILSILSILLPIPFS